MSKNAPLIALVKDERLRQPIQQWADKHDCEIIWQLNYQGVVTKLAQLRPQTILIELDNTSGWTEIVRALKINAATRRYSVLGFRIGLTEDVKSMAKSVGVDEIFEAQDSPQGKYLTTLDTRLNIHARRTDMDLQAELTSPCQEPLPAIVYKGIQQFNRGEYYSAHDALEEAWVAEERPVRQCYQGILQTGIAYHHIQKGNYWGAVKMFLRAFQWLAPLPDTCHGIHIAHLRQDADVVFQMLLELGQERLPEFDQALFTTIQIDNNFIPTKEN